MTPLPEYTTHMQLQCGMHLWGTWLYASLNKVFLRGCCKLCSHASMAVRELTKGNWAQRDSIATNCLYVHLHVGTLWTAACCREPFKRQHRVVYRHLQKFISCCTSAFLLPPPRRMFGSHASLVIMIRIISLHSLTRPTLGASFISWSGFAGNHDQSLVSVLCHYSCTGVSRQPSCVLVAQLHRQLPFDYSDFTEAWHACAPKICSVLLMARCNR